MEKPQRSSQNLPNAVSPEAQPMGWVAPLQSIRTFSIAEFTQFDASPGNDGNGPLTQS